MAIRFLTDSTADILPQEAARRDIDLVPLKVLFGEEVCRDGVDMDHAAFYQRLAEAERLPTTSQPTPDDFLPHFQRAKERGDSLICLLIASSLSGTCQSALIAKELCGYEEIYVVDSTQTVLGLRALVDLGEQLRAEGLPAGEIAARLEGARARVRLLAIVDTLEYLHKGGRLPAAVSIVGGLLKVKPIITLRDSALGLVGKGVGVKGCMASLLKLMGDGWAPDPCLPVYFGFSADDGLCRKLMEQVEERYGPRPHEVHSVGAVIGTHVGPGAAVVVWLERGPVEKG